MDTEDQILKGIKLITHNRNTEIKNLEQRLHSQKYNIKNTKENKSKNKNIYMKFALKIGSFFCK